VCAKGLYVAVGNGTTNTVATSSDGITWTGRAKPIFSGGSNTGSGIATNGALFVAVGQGTSETIGYSTDGITWTSLGSSIFTTAGYGIAFNGSMWVAVGEGGATIAYSYTGSNWYQVAGSSSLFTRALGITWDGQQWYATGIASASSNNIQTSTDGITWTSINTTAFNTQANKVKKNTHAMGNLQVGAMDLLGNSYVASIARNHIRTLPSTLVFSDTLYVHQNVGRVSIPSPFVSTATLHVFGSMAKTAGSFVIAHPDPTKPNTRLRHSFVESPTRGDTLYQWTLSTMQSTFVLSLPDYFQALNENAQCWVTAQDSWGVGRATVHSETNQLVLETTEDGVYDVLCVATRKDEDAHTFDRTGGVELQRVK
jgi:hypothetical protein